jgi:hypothetical protein
LVQEEGLQPNYFEIYWGDGRVFTGSDLTAGASSSGFDIVHSPVTLQRKIHGLRICELDELCKCYQKTDFTHFGNLVTSGDYTVDCSSRFAYDAGSTPVVNYVFPAGCSNDSYIELPDELAPPPIKLEGALTGSLEILVGDSTTSMASTIITVTNPDN